MKRILITVGLAAALVAALPAAAQPGPYGPRRGEPGGPGPMHREYRGDPAQREFRNPNDPYRGGGRMSPDERRQLRRDIDNAGRDLYRERPDRPGPPRQGPGFQR
jgi:hypothetical protein